MRPLRAGDHELPLGDVTHVMGVINLSPDSRNTATVAADVHAALEMARRYRRWGATIIDLGGQSSHYENPTIASELEMARVVPAVEALVADGFVISVDTWKPDVAAAAIEGGAHIVNDTGGLGDPEMRRVVAEAGVPAVAVYVEGDNPHAVDAVSVSNRKAETTADWFRERLADLGSDGITEVIIDPGIAINYRGDYDAYTRMQLQVIRDSRHLHALGRPVLIPVPRKPQDHRVPAYIALAVEAGADIIRVHDVEWACDLVDLLGRAAG